MVMIEQSITVTRVTIRKKDEGVIEVAIGNTRTHNLSWYSNNIIMSMTDTDSHLSSVCCYN